jgi:hypothetical protein
VSTVAGGADGFGCYASGAGRPTTKDPTENIKASGGCGGGRAAGNVTPGHDLLVSAGTDRGMGGRN